MKIAIIGGTGKMGRGFASALSSQHDVVVASRDPKRADKIARSTGANAASPYADAVDGSDVVILAVPWRAMQETTALLGDVAGKVVVDISAPYGPEREALGSRSSGEMVQKWLRGARVVKGWNHVFAKYLTAPDFDGIATSVLLAGDDDDAKKVVSGLARDMGFHPVDVGKLRQSHHLDRLVSMILFVKLGPFRVLTAPP